ncbi:MAG: homoserine dehydrogenase [Alphaproteobacteria bacterium]|nr:homoserine dehydrogenase [Alphaproteobacteria bacterium]
MLTIAIAGLGTVGCAVVRQLRREADMIAARAGQPVKIAAVSARHKGNKRNCDLSGIAWVDDPDDLSVMPDVDAVVELIGGADDPAHRVVQLALANGKHVVTANKALMAKHGPALAALAEKSGVRLSFEAAVGGGIPVIKAFRESMAGDSIESFCGILNGTCNYILTRMREEAMSFESALADAQKHGYAEADPAADVDGHDTANKLAILSGLAFGVQPDVRAVTLQGLRHISHADIGFAEDLGYRIKMLGQAQIGEEGIEQRVGPALVPKSLPLAHVEGTMNAVLLHGRYAGPLMLEGLGAGGPSTANAVVADLVDLARGGKINTFLCGAERLKPLVPAKLKPTRYYLRLQVDDKPGVVADVASVMRDEALSFESLIQRGGSSTQSVPVIITTHAGDVAAMQRAVDRIAKLPSVRELPCLIPMEEA